MVSIHEANSTHLQFACFSSFIFVSEQALRYLVKKILQETNVVLAILRGLNSSLQLLYLGLRGFVGELPLLSFSARSRIMLGLLGTIP